MNRMTCGAKVGGFFGTAQAYWSPYDELQRAAVLRPLRLSGMMEIITLQHNSSVETILPITR